MKYLICGIVTALLILLNGCGTDDPVTDLSDLKENTNISKEIEVGSILEVTGTIVDIQYVFYDYHRASYMRHDTMLYIGLLTTQNRYIECLFDNRLNGKFRHTEVSRAGDITVTGRVKIIAGDDIVLEDCEIPEQIKILD